MKFIKQEVFLDHKGNSQAVDDETGRKIWNGEMLALIANKYTPQNGLLIETVGEIRKLKRGIGILEAGAVDGFYSLEDKEYNLVKKVVIFMVLRMPALVMSADTIEDIFEGVTSRLPKELDKELDKAEVEDVAEVR